MPHPDLHITSQLSEHQMRMRNVLHSASHAKSFPYRFLTISRDEGTPGDEIARLLAQCIGWQLYDKEIVNEIAKDNRVREDLVRQLDEKDRGSLHNMIVRMLQMSENKPFGSEEYHESLMKTIAAIAVRGEAILVGRGANFVLHKADKGLHVRFTGSPEVRLQRLVHLWNVAPEIARRRMSEIDEDRKAFILRHFKQNIDDLRFYSLVINTDCVPVSRIVASLTALLSADAL